MPEAGRRLLVLAASAHQVPIIRAAQALCVQVLTTDNTPDNPGHALADAAFSVDTTDREGVLALARAQAIDGIIAACTDVAVPTAAYVAERLGLPGVPFEAAQILTDKLRFRAWRAARGRGPDFIELPEAAPGLGWTPGWAPEAAWVVKPARSSGSKGIFIVRDAAELARLLPVTRAFDPEGRALLERFVEGEQGCVEGCLEAGQVRWAMTTLRLTAPPPYVATRGHQTPGPFSAATVAALVADLEDVFRRLGVVQGPFNCDFVVGEDGTPHLLEVSPRLGGNALSDLAAVSCGIDLPQIAVRLALGLPVTGLDTRAARPAAVLLLGVEQAGRLVVDLEALAALRALPWIHDATLSASPGRRVEAFVNGRHQLGRVLLSAPDPATLRERIAEVEARLPLSTTAD